MQFQVNVNVVINIFSNAIQTKIYIITGERVKEWNSFFELNLLFIKNIFFFIEINK